MKKFFAFLMVAVMVMAMGVTAFADDALMTKEGNASSAEKYVISFDGLTEDQINSIVKIEAKVSVTSNMVNGCIGYNNASTGWSSTNQEVSAEAAPAEGTWVLEAEAGAFAAVDEDGALAPYAEIQFWWVNPIYDEDGAEVGAGVATLTSVTLYDAAGNVVAPGAEPAGDATPVVAVAVMAMVSCAAVVVLRKKEA